MKAISLDIETLSLNTDAVVLTIGAVWFDFEQRTPFNQLLQQGVTVYVDVSAQDLRHRSDSTIKWWDNLIEKDYRTAHSLEHTERTHPYVVFEKLEQMLTEKLPGVNFKSLDWFARGPHFDFAVLINLAEEFETSPPWQYNRIRDTRTFVDAVKMVIPFSIDWPVKPDACIEHDALHDAAYDALILQDIYNQGRKYRI